MNVPTDLSITAIGNTQLAQIITEATAVNATRVFLETEVHVKVGTVRVFVRFNQYLYNDCNFDQLGMSLSST